MKCCNIKNRWFPKSDPERKECPEEAMVTVILNGKELHYCQTHFDVYKDLVKQGRVEPGMVIHLKED